MPKHDFTYLQILEKGKGKEKSKVLCLLCGNITSIKTSHVLSKEQISCGCIQSIKPIKDLTGACVNGILFYGYLGGAKWKVKYSCGHWGIEENNTALKRKNSVCTDCIEWQSPTTTHGKSKNNKTYRAWCNMKRRCYDTSNNRYSTYGAVGIKVCDEWLESFENFYEDMGECPEGLSLERKELDDNYCPENCIWADNDTQANNKRNTVRIQGPEGEQASLRKWCRLLDKDYKSSWYHIFNRGKSVEEVLGPEYTLINRGTKQ